MIKKAYLLIAIAIIFSMAIAIISCVKHSNKRPKIESNLKNLKITWGSDSSCLIFNDFYNPQIKIIPKNLISGNSLLLKSSNSLYNPSGQTVDCNKLFAESMNSERFFKNPNDLSEVEVGVSEICYTLFRGKLTTLFAGKEMQPMLQ